MELEYKEYRTETKIKLQQYEKFDDELEFYKAEAKEYKERCERQEDRIYSMKGQIKDLEAK